MERFAIPGVAGIIEGKINNKDCILIRKDVKIIRVMNSDY